VSLGNLHDDGAVQLVLPLDPRRGLDAAVDEIRDRYGSAAITRAVLLGRESDPAVPLLPD
jgi:DNA polymerase-4